MSHSSGKLAQWGLTLQKLNIVIKYRPGKHNTQMPCRGTLWAPRWSKCTPLSRAGLVLPGQWPDSGGVKASLLTLAEEQCKEMDLMPLIEYTEKVELPSDDKQARKLAVE